MTYLYAANEKEIKAAAEGRFRAIAFPLPYAVQECADAVLSEWMLFKPGDRFYLAEPWIWDGQTFWTWSDRQYAALWDGQELPWCPAETMPAGNAEYWFEVQSVSLCPARNAASGWAVLAIVVPIKVEVENVQS